MRVVSRVTEELKRERESKDDEREKIKREREVEFLGMSNTERNSV